VEIKDTFFWLRATK